MSDAKVLYLEETVAEKCGPGNVVKFQLSVQRYIVPRDELEEYECATDRS